MQSNFSRAYDRVRVYEGGNVDHPDDPGGRTSRGIIQRVYDGYRDRKHLARRNVYNASEAEVKEIYHTQYWDAVKGDLLPSGVDLFVYDCAVNSGPTQAIKWLQRALRIQADGHCGQATLAAVAADRDNDALIAHMANQRMRFLRNLKHWPTFGKGWTRRVDNVERISQAWASGSVGPQPAQVLEEGGNQKAEPTEATQPMVSQEAGMATTAASSTGSVLLDTIQNTIGMLQGLDYITYIKYALVALAVLAFIVTIYSIWRTSRIKEATA